ncbi:FAD-dependent monooxygenase [Sorangium sp. So ce321]|uniref:FAD-dependent monooxygenase n=1 Tax=Sorangium sp. So ce321 TaxID=3133300 RepID=UPI003F6135CA
MKRHVLITGASIAGPALAWWLDRHGMAVTVVERAPSFRDGGQNIDVRGAGRKVVQRMGLEDAIRQRTTHEEAIAFVDERNNVRARIGAEQFRGNGPVAELEILRSELARLLLDHSRGSANYILGDRIAALRDRGDKVDVRFERGDEREYDLVIVAEGIGSSTREMQFGDEVKRVPLDLYIAYFAMPRGENDGNVSRWFNAPGGRSVFLRPDNLGTTRAALSLQEKPRGYEKLSQDEQKALLKARFADAGWETPRVLAALDEAKDFYFESIGQVKMPRWSKGRVVLVGEPPTAPRRSAAWARASRSSAPMCSPASWREATITPGHSPLTSASCALMSTRPRTCQRRGRGSRSRKPGPGSPSSRPP